MPVKKSAILLLILLISSVSILVFSADTSSNITSPKKCPDPVKCSLQEKEVSPAGGFPSHPLF